LVGPKSKATAEYLVATAGKEVLGVAATFSAASEDAACLLMCTGLGLDDCSTVHCAAEAVERGRKLLQTANYDTAVMVTQDAVDIPLSDISTTFLANTGITASQAPVDAADFLEYLGVPASDAAALMTAAAANVVAAIEVETATAEVSAADEAAAKAAAAVAPAAEEETGSNDSSAEDEQEAPNSGTETGADSEIPDFCSSLVMALLQFASERNIEYHCDVFEAQFFDGGCIADCPSDIKTEYYEDLHKSFYLNFGEDCGDSYDNMNGDTYSSGAGAAPLFAVVAGATAALLTTA